MERMNIMDQTWTDISNNFSKKSVCNETQDFINQEMVVTIFGSNTNDINLLNVNL